MPSTPVTAVAQGAPGSVTVPVALSLSSPSSPSAHEESTTGVAPAAAATERTTVLGGVSPAIVVMDLFLTAMGLEPLQLMLLVVLIGGLAIALVILAFKISRHRRLLMRLARRIGLLEHRANVYVVCSPLAECAAVRDDLPLTATRGDGTCDTHEEFEWTSMHDQ